MVRGRHLGGSAVEQESQDEYLARRAAEARAAEVASRDPRARRVHRDTAEFYEEQLAQLRRRNPASDHMLSRSNRR